MDDTLLDRNELEIAFTCIVFTLKTVYVCSLICFLPGPRACILSLSILSPSRPQHLIPVLVGVSRNYSIQVQHSHISNPLRSTPSKEAGLRQSPFSPLLTWLGDI